jgi:hypothetical protein
MPITPEQAQKDFDEKNAPNMEHAKSAFVLIDSLLSLNPGGTRWSTHSIPYISNSTKEYIVAAYQKVGWNATVDGNFLVICKRTGLERPHCPCGPGGCRDPNGHWSGH